MSVMKYSSDLQLLMQSIESAGLIPRLALLTSPSNPAVKYWHASIHNDLFGADFRYDSATDNSSPLTAMVRAYDLIRQPKPIRTAVASPPRVATSLADLGL